MADESFSVGDQVEISLPRPRPAGDPHIGRFVRIERPTDVSDASALFVETHLQDRDTGLWVYMPYGPFESDGAMRRWFEQTADSTNPLFFVVRDSDDGHPVGMASYLNIVPEHGSLEIGHIWYIRRARRTAVNTETIYLMLKECFDELHYRRVEWKCDALNERSIRAALRLGFGFEGIFRQHCVVKGRNRDTAWFSMLDHEWQARKANFEAVLYDSECRSSLTSLNAKLDAWPNHKAVVEHLKPQVTSIESSS